MGIVLKQDDAFNGETFAFIYEGDSFAAKAVAVIWFLETRPSIFGWTTKFRYCLCFQQSYVYNTGEHIKQMDIVKQFSKYKMHKQSSNDAK